jgi:hypothetical protein
MPSDVKAQQVPPMPAAPEHYILDTSLVGPARPPDREGRLSLFGFRSNSSMILLAF